MGFPYETADWAVVDGAMYMGAGGIMPGVYTAVAMALCVYVLWVGNRSEQKQYDKAEKK